MISPCIVLRNYQRGGWGPGTKHQKHMTLNPTTYLYRFPGPHGPGPYTMKYWWTLGCFPNGLETPFRLPEFLSTYQKEHVPLEVEDWLSCYVKDPLTELIKASKEFLQAVEEYPMSEVPRGYMPAKASVVPLLAPMKKFQEQLGIVLPPAGVRCVMCDPTLRERFLDDLFDYQELIERNGSTPHRRLARKSIQNSLQLDGHHDSELGNEERVEVSEKLSTFIGIVASPPETTSDDEKKLVRMLTTISEGCLSSGNSADASTALSDALLFCHSPDALAVTHANLASVHILNGDFKSAEYSGREAALLQSQVTPTCRACSKGYTSWATAVAYQDDLDKADLIARDGLAMFKGNRDLEIVAEQIGKMRARQSSLCGSSDVPHSLRGSRNQLPSQRSKALLNGDGRGFNNEFDWVVFKEKLYPSKMNPQSNEMGSVFRRVGDLGSFISTSRSMEKL